MQLDEDFLQYIWQFRLFTRLSLFCTSGETLQILHPGIPNTDAGPDFTMARLIIDGQLWVGNVEIHLRSSDWNIHHHQNDDAYNSVILHAVYEDDTVICRRDGSRIPVLLLRGLIPEDYFLRYRDLLDNRNFFPCAGQISTVPQDIIKQLFNSLPAYRLDQKVAEINHKLRFNHNDWNQTLFEILAKNFGFKVNALPFELLAGSVHHTIIAKHRDNPFQVEALLFGQAGLLQHDFHDRYPRQLKAEYLFLQKKYELKAGDASVWKFMRMRPQNFPPIRIAQLAGFLCGRQGILAALLEVENLDEVKTIFKGINVHVYWKDHSAFDRSSKGLKTEMGKASVDNLIINTICPLLYAYGAYFSREALKARALRFLENIPAERNAVIRGYTSAGLALSNAADSQAVLYLHKTRCMPKKCLHCIVGRAILIPAD